MLNVILCDACYCIVCCPVLHCSTLPPGINPFAVNNNSNNNNNNNVLTSFYILGVDLMVATKQPP